MTLSICLKNMWLKTTEEDCNLIKRKVIKKTQSIRIVFFYGEKKDFRFSVYNSTLYRLLFKNSIFFSMFLYVLLYFFILTFLKTEVIIERSLSNFIIIITLYSI